MKTFDAWILFGSCPGLFMITKLCELDQAAFSVPICGSGAAPHSRPLTAPRGFMFQMPFHMKAFLSFWKAVNSASCAKFLGLYPCLTTSTIQLKASTPASELKVALVASSLYRSPPNCRINDIHMSTPVNGNGDTQNPWIPLPFICSSATM